MSRQVVRGFLALAGLLLVLGLHNYYPLPSGTELWASYRDALHVPMFVLVASLFWWLLGALPQGQRVVLSMLSCTLFAIVSEAIQLFREVGTASVADLGVDLLASLLTLLILWLLTQRKRYLTWNRGVACLLLFSLTWLAVYPLWVTRSAYESLESIYPRLTDYAMPSALLFHDCRTSCSLRELEDSADNRGIGLLVTFEGADWPGVNLLEVLAPSPTHKQLGLDFELHGSEPLELFVIFNPSQLRSSAQTVQHTIYPHQTSLKLPLQQLMLSQPKSETYRIGIFTAPQFSGRQIMIKSLRYGP